MTSRATNRRQLDGSWVAYLDAFGFSAAVESKKPERIEHFFSEIYERLAQSNGAVTAAYQFSDSIFLIQEPFPEPQTKLQLLCSMVQDLQRIALQYGLAFRGAVTFGTVNIGPFGCYGHPVVEAARLEQHLPSPIVVLPERFIEKANEYLAREHDQSVRIELTTQIVETKTGAILANVIPAPHRLFAMVAHKKIRESLMYGPDYLAAAWKQAIEAQRIFPRTDEQENIRS